MLIPDQFLYILRLMIKNMELNKEKKIRIRGLFTFELDFPIEIHIP